MSDRLTSVFGKPESVDREPRRDGDTTDTTDAIDAVDAVERDVLAPAARIMIDAFAPEPNTRVQMNGSNLALGWPQMEQMLAE